MDPSRREMQCYLYAIWIRCLLFHGRRLKHAGMGRNGDDGLPKHSFLYFAYLDCMERNRNDEGVKFVEGTSNQKAKKRKC